MDRKQTMPSPLYLGGGWCLEWATEAEARDAKLLWEITGQVRRVAWVLRGARVAGCVFGRCGNGLAAWYDPWDHEN
jgi:hypothetical protein